ncbi:antiviral protein II/III-like [Amaranthus tricolor]|uniref:antiviral protein II/III-like n=1 Tax=Amaranthus tricolor TaxID=29722 RepID=UPI00258AA1E0|nr:antiviral protein II/III-like [Amaranthus tricolor]
MKKITNLVYILVAITTSVILQWTCNAADPKFIVTNGATSQSYSTLLNDFRDRVKDPKLTGTYGFQNNLPVVAAPTKPAKYLYMDIQADNGIITAAFDKNDLYYMGYAHTADGVKKVRLFKDAPTDVRLIFPDVTNKNNRYYSTITGNYNNLGDRASVGLGAKPLNKFISEEIYTKKKFDMTTDKKLALMVIQTIAEAARFTYIEGEIVSKFSDNSGFKCNDKAKSLENNWEKTSKTVKGSTGPRIDLELKDENGKVVWKWLQVGELVDVIGILKYLK